MTVAGPCASLWACSSPRSRCRAQPAPWLWCCRSFFNVFFKKEKQAAHFSCCRMWSQVRKGDGENFPVHFVYSCAALQVPVQPAPISPLPLQCAAPVCRLPGCGSDLSGHGLHSARTRRRRRRREVQQKERPDYPRSLQHVEVRQTHFFFFCFLRKFQLINFSF